MDEDLLLGSDLNQASIGTRKVDYLNVIVIDVLTETDDSFFPQVDLVAMQEDLFIGPDPKERTVRTLVDQDKRFSAKLDIGMIS